jgi:hypothetical protein
MRFETELKKILFFKQNRPNFAKNRPMSPKIVIITLTPGLAHMFYPKMESLLQPTVWLNAAVQVKTNKVI